MSKFAGNVAFVTGAGSGIGRAMALALAEGEAAVMCADINEQGAQATAARLEEIDDSLTLEGVSAYVAAKHGVIGLTRQFALAFGKYGVRVNAVCPGYIVTPMTARAREAEGGTEFLEALHPIGRLGEPHEVANVAAFLAGPDASFVTGTAVPVDGGYSAR